MRTKKCKLKGAIGSSRYLQNHSFLFQINFVKLSISVLTERDVLVLPLLSGSEKSLYTLLILHFRVCVVVLGRSGSLWPWRHTPSLRPCSHCAGLPREDAVVSGE